MFRKNKWLSLIALVMLCMACDFGQEERAVAPSSINKFEAELNNYSGRILYSYTFEDFDYYYIYLGELKHIPIFFFDPEYHDGVHSEFSYKTTTTVTEETRTIVTRSSEEARSVVEEYTTSSTSGQKLGVEIGSKFSVLKIIEVEGQKVNGELSWEQYRSSTAGSTTQITKSLADTVDRAIAFTHSEEKERKFPLGENKKAGWYRYTLLSVSDVYLWVIRNPKTNEIYYEFREYVVPGSFGWYLDYSETLSFRKSDATSFELDVSILDDLPQTRINLNDNGVQYYTIEYDANGGSGSMGYTFHFYGVEQNLRRNAFVHPTGYLFAGWARSPTATAAEFTDGQDVLNLVNERGASITLYAVWRTKGDGYEEITFTTAGNNAYVFNKSFPAIIEVYVLGAGGGGQGGHHSDVINVIGIGGTPSTGTGGAGGGGAAAYMKFSITEPVTFNITVGKGGAAGTGVSRSNTQEWQSGNPGGNGGDTTVSWGTNTITAKGGARGGGSGQILTGGSGGAVTATWPTIILDKFSLAGGKGTNGTRGYGSGGNIESRGGSAASISVGSQSLFGGGNGAVCPAGQTQISETVGRGGGGSGGYDSSRSGTPGGDGYALIVVTH